ncbi:MAG: glycosyltransferase family 4 protein [Opitutaceae bacterium]|nr:glycosyltransferase family 4 protein [Opitutaceae bacterium]
MALLGLPAAKLEVVHLAATLADREEAVLGLPDEFCLFVGSLEPGKNLAFLRTLWLSAGPALPPLVIVGARWPGVAREGAPPPGWIYLGHRSDAVLRWLYGRATALLFPSLYEGFGLPPLEAMAAGCPVICSPRASLPEVVGDAAPLVELETGPWRAALDAVRRDAAGWRQRGRERAALFSWERCARETVAVYRTALGG